MAAMRHMALVLSTLWIVLLLSAHSCLAEAPLRTALLCRNAIAAAETARHVPDAFLSAIAKVESGRLIAGMVVPWPWTINAEGAGSFFATKDDAIAAVQALQARGVRSIDVGCMQVNLQQHPEAFRSLDQAFDPGTNAQFAAGLLVSLFSQFGSWPLAAAAYHSQTPTIGAAYQRQVLAAWAMPDRPAAPKTKGGTAQAGPPATAASAEPKHAAAAASGPPGTAGAGAAFGRETGFIAAGPPRAGGPHLFGRGLDSYRQIPIRVALRPAFRPG